MIDLSIEKQHEPKIICGVDEVGRGPLAGPVISCAVIVRDYNLKNINDSKKLSINKRIELDHEIRKEYIFSIGEASVEEIDQYNILNATKLSMQRAVEGLSITPEIVLVDGNMKFDDSRYISIIKGDSKCYSIASASIVAKVYRDKLMSNIAQEFNSYGWERNSGYGTKTHINAIKEYGITTHHRKTFLKNIT